MYCHHEDERPAAAATREAVENQVTSLERAIVGALRAAIHDHGPITPALVTSAAKRVLGNLQNAQLGDLAAADMGKRRWAGTTEAERREKMTGIGSSGGRAAWAKLTPEERSEEMRRRAAKRRRRPKVEGTDR